MTDHSPDHKRHDYDPQSASGRHDAKRLRGLRFIGALVLVFFLLLALVATALAGLPMRLRVVPSFRVNVLQLARGVFASILVHVTIFEDLRAPFHPVTPVEIEDCSRVRMIASIRICIILALSFAPLKAARLGVFTALAVLSQTHSEIANMFTPLRLSSLR